ncbi:MAG: DUF2283 domain-containing protein [Synechococcales bacterium]|nr:DUF2283 domain-containing protein [Synechococcales bacterium]
MRVGIDYDSEADVLYISFQTPQQANDSILEENAIYHYRDQELVGITVLRAAETYGDRAVIEATATGYSAYSPDWPGCVSTGATRDAVKENMREALIFHLEGLTLDGKGDFEGHHP